MASASEGLAFARSHSFIHFVYLIKSSSSLHSHILCNSLSNDYAGAQKVLFEFKPWDRNDAIYAIYFLYFSPLLTDFKIEWQRAISNMPQHGGLVLVSVNNHVWQKLFTLQRESSSKRKKASCRRAAEA